MQLYQELAGAERIARQKKAGLPRFELGTRVLETPMIPFHYRPFPFLGGLETLFSR